jgi:hypothetical protein
MSAVKKPQSKRAKPHSRVTHTVNSNSNEARNPLRVVPHAQDFHFYKAIGCCIGVTSCSLKELHKAVNEVCSEAILFHFGRGDFQNWIRDIIGDAELAQNIDDIKMCSRKLSAERCRQELAERLRIRIFQLETRRLEEN